MPLPCADASLLSIIFCWNRHMTSFDHKHIYQYIHCHMLHCIWIWFWCYYRISLLNRQHAYMYLYISANSDLCVPFGRVSIDMRYLFVYTCIYEWGYSWKRLLFRPLHFIHSFSTFKSCLPYSRFVTKQNSLAVFFSLFIMFIAMIIDEFSSAKNHLNGYFIHSYWLEEGRRRDALLPWLVFSHTHTHIYIVYRGSEIYRKKNARCHVFYRMKIEKLSTSNDSLSELIWNCLLRPNAILVRYSHS